MAKTVLTQELFDCDVEYLASLFASNKYPWEMLPKIKKDLEAKAVKADE